MKGFMILGVIVFVIALTSVDADRTEGDPCEIEEYANCNFVVKCKKISLPVVPDCGGEPNITLIISNSIRDILDTKFFSGPGSKYNKNVREIISRSNSWTNIDPAFYTFYNCLHIDLSHNHIVVINAMAFFKLRKLQFLNLSGNYIETFNPKSFLISKTKRNHLQILDLSNNNLHQIGRELNNLPYLSTLYLQNNKLTNIVDDAFVKLKQLNNLYLQHNFLTYISASLVPLQQLLTLDISNNNFKHINDIITVDKYYKPAMKNLNLSGNYLTELQEGNLLTVVKIEVLDLSRNYIKKLDAKIFRECEKLKTLIIDYNHMETFDVETIFLTNIRKLSLEGNPLACHIRNLEVPKSRTHTEAKLKYLKHTERSLEVIVDKVYRIDRFQTMQCKTQKSRSPLVTSGMIPESTTEIIEDEFTTSKPIQTYPLAETSRIQPDQSLQVIKECNKIKSSIIKLSEQLIRYESEINALKMKVDDLESIMIKSQSPLSVKDNPKNTNLPIDNLLTPMSSLEEGENNIKVELYLDNNLDLDANRESDDETEDDYKNKF